MGCSCTIDTDWGEAIKLCKIKSPMARKSHKCDECGREIKKGEEYELVKGLLDGEWMTHKTCEDCESVRGALFCNYLYGTVWEDIHDSLCQDDKPPSSECMMMMTKRGRDKVCDLLEKIWEESDEN